MNSGLALLIVFCSIVLVIYLTKKLTLGILCGCAMVVVCYQLPLLQAGQVIATSAVEWATLELVLILYLITLLQRMLERNGRLVAAQQAIGALCPDRRVNTFLSSMMIGLLPSSAVVKICGDMVDEAAGEHLTREEKAFVASYYRHIFESYLPTYTAILLAVELGGISTPAFLIGMFPIVLAQIAVGYWYYLRKLPKDTGIPPSDAPGRDLKIVLRGIWPLLLILLLILVARLTTFVAVLVTTLLYLVLQRPGWRAMPGLLRDAFESRLLINMFLICIFKGLIAHTGVIESLPQLFTSLPIPQFLIYVLIFLVGGIVGGNTMIVSIALPLAMAAIPGAGMPLVVLLSTCAYLAMQISPTHICLDIIVEHFHITMGGLIRRTLPVISILLVISIGYYLLLTAVF